MIYWWPIYKQVTFAVKNVTIIDPGDIVLFECGDSPFVQALLIRGEWYRKGTPIHV